MKKTKRKKKMVGYMIENWTMDFEQLNKSYIMHDTVMSKPREYCKTKVRITIEEI